jgi:hypothetical protein
VFVGNRALYWLGFTNMDPLLNGCYLIYVILKNMTCGWYEMVGHVIHVVYVLI